MSGHGDEFDPGLADAVRRCWAGERSGDDLRRRVAAQVAADRRRRPVRWLAWGSAAAAVLAMAFGLGLLTRPAKGPAVASVLSPVTEAALVRTHDQCSRGADHQHLPVPRDNGYAIAAALRSRLDRPVLVSRPADDGWRFGGASVCPVGAVRAAHLVFHRADGDALSVFSLPRSAAPGAADGEQFRAEVGGHAIVGFVRHGAVYCLVGSGCAADTSVEKLADVRDRMERQTLVADAGPAAGPAADRELIHVAGH